MAKKLIPVPETEKGNPGVQEATTMVGTDTFTTYVKVEFQDDVSNSADDVATLNFSYPELKSSDEEGEEDYWSVAHREIDLGKANREKLLKALKPFIDASREVTLAPARSSRSRPAASGPDPVKVREWAKKFGHEVNDRGRVPEKIVEAYLRANPEEK